MVRATIKAGGLAIVIAGAVCDYYLRGAGREPEARGRWLNRWAKKLARAVALEIEVCGQLPANGFLVANHVSYLDIVALATIGPMTFVSKADVRKWPVFGFLAACAGTIFVRRESKLDVERVNGAIGAAAARGSLVTLFPEGTSSDGRSVLPFKSSLLQPAVGKAVCPAWIRYETDGGVVESDVAYWGDAVFGLHLWKFLSLRRTRCSVRFGAPIIRADRKQLAAECRLVITELSGSAVAQLRGFEEPLAIAV